MALGLRVVSDDGGPERFRQALFRALAGFIEIWMFAGGPAVICSLVSPKGKRIGDVFAGTMVISERAPKTEPAAGDAAVAGVVGVVAAAVRAAAPSRRSWPASSSRAQLSWTRACAIRWPTGSTPRWSRRSPLRHRRALRRSWCLAAVLAERHRRELTRLRRPAPPVRPSTPPATPPGPWPPAYARPGQPWPAPPQRAATRGTLDDAHPGSPAAHPVDSPTRISGTLMSHYW